MSDTTKLNDGGTAFPIDRTRHDTFGLTKREWFAGMALAGLCQGYHDNSVSSNEVAECAFRIADEMLEVGEQKEPTAEAI